MNRNRVLVALTLICSTLFVSFYGGRISYSLFYFSWMLPLLSVVYTFYVYSRIKIYETLEHHKVVKGELNPYSFTLGNEDIIAYRNVRIHYRKEKSSILKSDLLEEFSLAPGDSIIKSTYIRGKYRGEYEVGVGAIEITDLLSIVKIRYKVSNNLNITVLPRIISLEDTRFIKNNPDVKQVLMASIKGETILDVETRPYMRGDSKKQIHWKATSKEHRLMSRKIQTQPKNKIAVYLDLSFMEEEEFRYIYEDQVIELAISFASFALEEDIFASFYYDYIGRKEYQINSRDSFLSFYNECSSLNFRSQTSIITLLQSSKKEVEKTMILITSNIVEELYPLLYERKKEGVHLVVIVIANIAPMSSMLQVLKNMDISCVVIRKEELEEETYEPE